MLYLLTAIFGLSAIILKNGRTIDAILGIFQMSLMLLSLMLIMRKGGDLLKRNSEKIQIITFDDLFSERVVTKQAIEQEVDEFRDLGYIKIDD